MNVLDSRPNSTDRGQTPIKDQRRSDTRGRGCRNRSANRTPTNLHFSSLLCTTQSCSHFEAQLKGHLLQVALGEPSGGCELLPRFLRGQRPRRQEAFCFPFPSHLTAERRKILINENTRFFETRGLPSQILTRHSTTFPRVGPAHHRSRHVATVPGSLVGAEETGVE